jgi:hypothetical protein
MQARKLKIFLLKISLDFYGFFLYLFKTKCNKFMDNMGLIYIQRKGNWSVKETSALFTIAEKWKQPKYPGTDEWVDHVIHIH